MHQSTQHTVLSGLVRLRTCACGCVWAHYHYLNELALRCEPRRLCSHRSTATTAADAFHPPPPLHAPCSSASHTPFTTRDSPCCCSSSMRMGHRASSSLRLQRRPRKRRMEKAVFADEHPNCLRVCVCVLVCLSVWVVESLWRRCSRRSKRLWWPCPCLCEGQGQGRYRAAPEKHHDRPSVCCTCPLLTVLCALRLYIGRSRLRLLAPLPLPLSPPCSVRSALLCAPHSALEPSTALVPPLLPLLDCPSGWTHTHTRVRGAALALPVVETRALQETRSVAEVSHSVGARATTCRQHPSSRTHHTSTEAHGL